MKKKLAGLLAALMVLTMGTTVFAATSPTAEDIAKAENAVTSVTTDAGVSLSKSQIAPAEYKEAAQKATTITADAEVLAAFELTAPAGTTSGPMNVTISVAGIKAGDTVMVLHKCSKHGVWETITPSKVEDGKVTFGVDSLSPIAIVRTASAPQGGTNGGATEPQPDVNNYYTTNNYYTNPSATNGNTTTNATNSGITQSNNNSQVVNITTPATAVAPGASTSNTSPKTGVNPVLPLIAVLSVIGIAVCTKKARSL